MLRRREPSSETRNWGLLSNTVHSVFQASAIASHNLETETHSQTQPQPRERKTKRVWAPQMETGAAGAGLAAAEDQSSSSTSSSSSPAAAFSRWSFSISRRYQHLLDKSTPHMLHRWLTCLGVALIYSLRVYLVQGFYIVSYGLGIYILNLLIGFLSPQVDPETHDLSDGPSLPTRGSDEFRPFVRRLPEFKFWYNNSLTLTLAFSWLVLKFCNFLNFVINFLTFSVFGWNFIDFVFVELGYW